MPTVGQFNAFCDAMIEYHTDQVLAAVGKRYRDMCQGYFWINEKRRDIDAEEKEPRSNLWWTEEKKLRHSWSWKETDYHEGEVNKWKVLRGELSASRFVDYCDDIIRCHYNQAAEVTFWRWKHHGLNPNRQEYPDDDGLGHAGRLAQWHDVWLYCMGEIDRWRAYRKEVLTNEARV